MKMMQKDFYICICKQCFGKCKDASFKIEKKKIIADKIGVNLGFEL